DGDLVGVGLRRLPERVVRRFGAAPGAALPAGALRAGTERSEGTCRARRRTALGRQRSDGSPLGDDGLGSAPARGLLPTCPGGAGGPRRWPGAGAVTACGPVARQPVLRGLDPHPSLVRDRGHLARDACRELERG